MQALESHQKLIQIQQTLSKNAYFSQSSLPGFADAVIFKLLIENKKYPDIKYYPFFFHWFVIMKQFSINSLEEWIKQKLYVQNQSDKCIMLISDIFYQSSSYFEILKECHQKKKIMEYIPKKPLTESSRFRPLDINTNLENKFYGNLAAKELKVIGIIRQILQAQNQNQIIEVSQKIKISIFKILCRKINVLSYQRRNLSLELSSPCNLQNVKKYFLVELAKEKHPTSDFMQMKTIYSEKALIHNFTT